ncbi:MAG TPA: succinate dehydrogenase assembly factor 2 [Stellaceae bacterium]|nr:succinate dehydrogenase assembly factor 2 [Stellaceae bacterium]
MDDAVETRRKRLLYQSGHRGTKESDLLLGAFAAAHLPGFSAAQLERFEALLDENDADLFDWIAGRTAPPAAKMSDVLELLLVFKYPGAR